MQDLTSDCATLDRLIRRLERKPVGSLGKSQIEHLITLKRQINANSPLMRLPSEVLRHIFHHAQPSRYGSLSISPGISVPIQKRRRTDDRLVRMMLICWYTWQLILDDCYLWSSIDFGCGSRKWYELCLKRAGPAALDLYGSLEPSTAERLTAKVVRQAWRIQLLIACDHNISHHHHHHHQEESWDARVTPVLEKRFKARSGTAVRLESLQVYPTCGEDPITLPLTRMLTFGISATPSPVTELILVRYNSDSGMPSLSFLQRLTLEEPLLDMQYTSLRHVLSQTPALKYLRIGLHPRWCAAGERAEIARHQEGASALQEQRPVYLPRLLEVDISGGPAQVAKFMLLLPAPQCKLVVKTSEQITNMELLGQYTDFLHIIRDRVVHFISQQAAIKTSSRSKPHSLGLQVSLSEEDVLDNSFIHLTITSKDDHYEYLKSVPNAEPLAGITLQVPLDFDLNALVACTSNTTLRFEDLDAFAPLLRSNASLTCVTASGMPASAVRNAARVAGPLRRNKLERILSERCALLGYPLKTLVLDAGGIDEHDWDHVTAKQVQAMGKRWKTAGWVEQVELVEIEGGPGDERNTN